MVNVITTNGVIKRLFFVIVLLTAAAGSACADAVYVYKVAFDIPVPASSDGKGWMSDAVVEVKFSHIIRDLEVSICVTHTNVFDLQIFLESPAGTRVCLNMYNPFSEFFEGADYTYTIFDDEALLSIKDGVAPFNGRFRPMDETLLSVFDGENAQGFWRLQIYDAYYYDSGTFDRFAIMFRNPEPATFALVAIGVGFAGLFKRRRWA